MKLFITNDDGIESDGIKYLTKELVKICDVIVVAPDRERSAVSHSLTFFDPLRLKEVKTNNKYKIYSLNGTPTDCVYLGLKHLLKEEKPALVISGINKGANLGDDINYSGTVAAAVEGTLQGVSSFAISLCNYKEVNKNFKFAARFAKKLAEFLLENPLPERTLLNVNVPDVSEKNIKGIAVTKQGKTIYKSGIEKLKDPRDRDMYWISSEYPRGIIDENTDYRAIEENKISLTPIKLDYTDHIFIKENKKKFEKILNNL